MSCHVLEILAALAHEVCKVEQRKLVFFLPTLCLPFWVQIMKVGLEGRKRIYPRSLHCETPSQAQHFSISVFLLLKTLVHGVCREVVGRGTLWTCRDHPVHPYLSWTTSPLTGPVPPVRWQACWQFPCLATAIACFRPRWREKYSPKQLHHTPTAISGVWPLSLLPICLPYTRIKFPCVVPGICVNTNEFFVSMFSVGSYDIYCKAICCF